MEYEDLTRLLIAMEAAGARPPYVLTVPAGFDCIADQVGAMALQTGKVSEVRFAPGAASVYAQSRTVGDLRLRDLRSYL